MTNPIYNYNKHNNICQVFFARQPPMWEAAKVVAVRKEP